jgi:ubiquinone biosynthesis protein
MEEVQGVPVRQAPEGEPRREAGRQLLEAYYEQVLSEGFFHADPHPGNLMWWNDRIYLLDLGMVGEVDASLRQSLLLLLLAFWQEDADFLADLMLGLSEAAPDRAFDRAAFGDALAALVARHRHLSLRELRLGPLLQELTEICLRHRVRLPAALAMVGKAFGQMQSTAAELDPSLDPFSVAEAFYARQLLARLRAATNPRRSLYEAQKLWFRVRGLLDGVERVLGAPAGSGLPIDPSGMEELTDAIGHTGRRVALGVTAGTALVGTAVAAGSPHAPKWTAPTFASAAAVLTGGLLADLMRRR